MKKWTYLVAAGMLLGATPVFTGCIDNDEPEGITALRGAKAELLKAKASVTAAMVEQVKAEAALKLAEAEIKKAEAARIQAMAAYEAAKAKEMEYKAELANIENEEKRAELENQIKIYAEARAAAERDAKEAAAKLEVTLATLKAKLVAQEAAYVTAMKDLALAKNTLTANQQNHLKTWSDAVSGAKTVVDQKSTAYEAAVEALADAIKTMDKTEAQESYLRTQKKAVADAELEFKKAQEALVIAEEYSNKTIDAADKWEAELTKIQADIKAIDIAVANLEVEKVKITQANAGLKTSVDDLKGTYQELTGLVWNESKEEFVFNGTVTEDIKLKDITLSFNYPGLDPIVDGTIEGTFKYSQVLQAEEYGFEYMPIQQTRLNDLKSDIEFYKLTPDGEAWNEHNLNQYKRNLVNLEKTFAEDKALWERYVKAYKNLENSDPSALEGFDKVEEAVAAYNDAVKQYNKDASAYTTFMDTKLIPASEKFELAKEENDKKRDEAGQKAWDEYFATDKSITNGIVLLKNAETTAIKAHEKALFEFNAIKEPTDADKKVLETAKKAQDTAIEKRIKAENEANGYVDKDNNYIKGSYQVANETRVYKLELIQKEHALAEAQIIENEFKEKPNLQALVNEATKLSIAKAESDVALNEALNNATSAISEVSTANGGIYISNQALYNSINASNPETGEREPYSVTPVEAAYINMYTLQSSIMDKSNALFGRNNQNGAYLVAPTKEEITAAIKKNYFTTNPDATFVPTYVMLNGFNNYGKLGSILRTETSIAQAEAVLKNAEKIEEYIATIDGHIADIKTQIEAYTKDVVTPAYEAFDTAYTSYEEKFVEVDKAIAEAGADKTNKGTLLGKIESAITVYLGQEKDPNGDAVTATNLETLRASLKTFYDNAVKAVYGKETELIDAKESLQAAIDDVKSPVELTQATADKAQKALEAAQAELKAALEALQAEIERISAE